LHVALEILFKNIFAYLIKERGVDGDLVRRLVRENKIYLSRSHNNLVMVDYDSEGKARFATNKEISARSGQFLLSLQSGERERIFPMTFPGLWCSAIRENRDM
jgi:hypothetical protein